MGVVATIDAPHKDFEPVAEMIQGAILADIVDKGEVDNKFKPGTKQHKCTFVWIVQEEDSEGRNKRVFETFTVSLNEKARLRKRLAEFGKKDFAPGEAVELDSFIGTKRILVLSEEDGSEPGKKYIKIQATMALKKGQTAPDVPKDFVRAQDRDTK